MDDPRAIPELLEPIVAGARARGVADAFELLGINAILVDRTGRVLHSGRNVERLLCPTAKITDGHLLGCDAAVNETLQCLIASAIAPSGQSGDTKGTIIGRAGEAGGLCVRVIRYAAAEHDPFQLLRAVLIVSARAD